MSFKAATTRASTSDNLTVKEDAKVEMGYNKISRGGLQALRVPIENFAGLFEAGHSNSVSVAPLQLVVDAVSSTKDYTVFSSQLMQVLLEFKWYGFARARFFAELAFYCVHTTVVLVYNITLSASVKHNFNLPKLLLGSEPAATDAEGVPSWDNRCVIIVGWVWTSFMCVNNMFQEFQQMRSGFPLPPYMKGFPALLRKDGYYTTNNVKTDYNTANYQAIINTTLTHSLTHTSRHTCC